MSNSNFLHVFTPRGVIFNKKIFENFSRGWKNCVVAPKPPYRVVLVKFKSLKNLKTFLCHPVYIKCFRYEDHFPYLAHTTSYQSYGNPYYERYLRNDYPLRNIARDTPYWH